MLLLQRLGVTGMFSILIYTLSKKYHKKLGHRNNKPITELKNNTSMC
jgi:hypothetical protein